MKKSQYFCLIIILLIAAGLRLWQLGKTPEGFYLDEAAIGYNAWSILKTGRDEYDKFLPLLFRSFTDFKAPIYIYALVPIEAIWGMTVWSTRWLSAAAGIVSVGFLFLLVKKISRQTNLALMAGLLMSISPWNIIFSRTAYETNLALMFLLISLWSFYKGKEKNGWLVISGVMAALSFLSYHSERVVVPLLFLVLFWGEREWWTKTKTAKKYLIAAIIGGGIIILPTVCLFLTPGFLSRLNSLSIFSTAVKLPWGYREGVINIKPLLSLREWLSLYVSYFSPRYMFNLGDPGPRSSYPDLATFWGWQLPFLIIGIRELLKRKKDELKLVVGAMLMIGPIPASITMDPYSSIRALTMSVPWLIIIAMGVEKIRKVWPKMTVIVMTILIFWSMGKMYLTIFKLNDFYRANSWNYGLEEIIEGIKEDGTKMPIVFDNSRGENYAQILFFTKKDPQEYQKDNFEVSEKNYYVDLTRNTNKKNGRIESRKINWETDIFKEQILAGDALAISDQQIKEHCLTILTTINYPNNQLAYRAVKTNPTAKIKFNQMKEETKSDDCWKVVGKN